MVRDWLDDPNLSADERMARFRALRPVKTSGPNGGRITGHPLLRDALLHGGGRNTWTA